MGNRNQKQDNSQECEIGVKIPKNRKDMVALIINQNEMINDGKRKLENVIEENDDALRRLEERIHQAIPESNDEATESYITMNRDVMSRIESLQNKLKGKKSLLEHNEVLSKLLREFMNYTVNTDHELDDEELAELEEIRRLISELRCSRESTEDELVIERRRSQEETDSFVELVQERRRRREQSDSFAQERQSYEQRLRESEIVLERIQEEIQLAQSDNQSRLMKKDESIALLKRKVESQKATVRQLQQQQVELEDQHQRLQLENSELRSSRVSTENELVQERHQRREESDSFAQERQSYEQRLRESVSSFVRIQEQLQSAQRENQSRVMEKDKSIALLEREVKSQKVTVRQLQQELTQERESSSQLKNVQSDLVEVRREFGEEKVLRGIRDKQLQDKQTELEEIKRLLSEEGSARQRLEEELKRMRNACAQHYRDERSTRVNLEDQLRRLQLENSELRCSRESTENELVKERRERREESDSFVQELQSYEQLLLESKIVFGRVQEELESVQRENQSCQRLEEELQRMQNDCVQHMDELENQRLLLQTLEHELEEREESLQASEQRYQDELSTRLNLQALHEWLRRRRREESDSFAQERQSYEQRLRESVSSLANSERRILELQTTVNSSQSILDDHHLIEPRDWIIGREEVALTGQLLGNGAWGKVEVGIFRSCKVAVKQIHELILSPHNRRLFEREISMAARCRHPCLLQFIGATNDDGVPLFITERLDGDLRAVLSRRSLRPKEIITIALDVARALNYLHLSKPFPIVHRDISSSNVMLWKRDTCWRAKLSDYGAANFMRQSMTVNPGAGIYAAPEASTSQQSPKVDIYSFGLLLCELCTGELPVPQQTQEQITLVTNGMLRELIIRCVRVDPETRPTMADIITLLKKQLVHQSRAKSRSEEKLPLVADRLAQ